MITMTMKTIGIYYDISLWLGMYVIVISQYKWVILIITHVQGETEDEGNN